MQHHSRCKGNVFRVGVVLAAGFAFQDLKGEEQHVSGTKDGHKKFDLRQVCTKQHVKRTAGEQNQETASTNTETKFEGPLKSVLIGERHRHDVVGARGKGRYERKNEKRND